MLKYQNSGVRNRLVWEEREFGAFSRQQMTAAAHIAFGVLDRLSAGIVLLDQCARTLYVNPAAQSFGSDGGILRFSDRTIATWSPMHSQRLGNLIRAALRNATAGSMSVPRPGDGQLLTILVSSVRGQDLAPFADFETEHAAVLLFMVDSGHRTAVPMQRLIDAYGLTRTEARVALAISSGCTVPEAAAQFGTSPNTIKTHLRAVFAKTGLTGQTGLSRLMASIGMVGAEPSPPLDGTRWIRKGRSSGNRCASARALPHAGTDTSGQKACGLYPGEQRCNRVDGKVRPLTR